MHKFILMSTFLIASPAHSEPTRGWLTGQEGDFLKFECEIAGERLVECDFTQVSMFLKQKPSEVETLLKERLADVREQVEDGDSEEDCQYLSAFPDVIDALIDKDTERATALMAELPEEVQKELDVEAMSDQLARLDPREIDDMRTNMSFLSKLCDDPTTADLEAMIRFELEKQARTCKLFVNNWSATFQSASDRLWTMADSQPQGVCSVVRLDRFECENGSYSCEFISEKRVLDKDSTRGLMCDQLEERSFRYVHDSDGVYLDCEIMSFF